MRAIKFFDRSDQLNDTLTVEEITSFGSTLKFSISRQGKEFSSVAVLNRQQVAKLRDMLTEWLGTEPINMLWTEELP